MKKRNWSDPVTIRPIGVVRSEFRDFNQPTDYNAESCIIIREDLTEGLTGLEHFSRLHVLYYQHRRGDWLKENGRTGDAHSEMTLPLSGTAGGTGIYTTRSPARPSATGACVAELLRHEKNRLYVRGLDAFDGTPVLDIKIYIARFDSFPDALSPLHWGIRQNLEETSRLLHWDTMNVGLSLGLKAGARAMRELDLVRGGARRAIVRGDPFFAHGVEGATGCSAMDHSLRFEDHSGNMSEWELVLTAGSGTVTVRLQNRQYTGAAEVLEMPDGVLFASVEKSPA